MVDSAYNIFRFIFKTGMIMNKRIGLAQRLPTYFSCKASVSHETAIASIIIISVMFTRASRSGELLNLETLFYTHMHTGSHYIYMKSLYYYS